MKIRNLTRCIEKQDAARAWILVASESHDGIGITIDRDDARPIFHRNSTSHSVVDAIRNDARHNAGNRRNLYDRQRKTALPEAQRPAVEIELTVLLKADQKERRLARK